MPQVFFTLLFTLFCAQAHAGQAHFNGMLGFERQTYFKDLGEPTRTADNLIHFRPEYDYRFNKKSHFFLKPFLRANLSTDETPENYFLNVKEAFLEVNTHPFRTRVGMNTHNWGVLDVYSPADNVDGRVLFSPLAADKRGTPSIDIQYDHRAFQLLFLYIPKQSRTLFPSADSRWLPRKYISSSSSEDGSIFVPPTAFHYEYNQYEELNNALKNNFGVKLSGQISSADLSVSFFQGSGINPEIEPTVSTTLVEPGPPPVSVIDPNVTLTPIYFRQNIYSANLVRTFDKMILKLETTYSESISKDDRIPARYSQSGFGIEVPWDLTSREVTTFFQIYYGDNKKSTNNVLNSSTRLFDRVAILGTRVAMTSKTNIVGSIMHDYSSDGYYINFTYDRKWTSKIKFSVAVDIIGGRQVSLLNTYNDNDRVNLGLTYLW
jgi:hypothetical protein